MARIASLLPVLLLAASSTVSAQGWQKLNAFPNTTTYTDVWFFDENDGFMTGNDGTINYTNDGGVTWGIVPSSATDRLNRIQFLDRNLGYIVGFGGVLLKTTNGGQQWTAIDAQTTKTLFDVHFFDENTGYVCGQGNFMEKTTDGGATWTVQNPGFMQNNVTRMFFSDPDNAVIVGNAGKMGYTDDGGEHWRSAQSPAKSAMYSVAMATKDVGTAVGDQGMIVRTTNGGKNWTQQYAEVPLSSYPLQDVKHFDSLSAIIVGWNGIILKTSNGGANWYPDDNPSADPLFAIMFIDRKIGWAVGFNGVVLQTKTGGTVGVRDAAVPAADALVSFPNPFVRSVGGVVRFAAPDANSRAGVLRVIDALGRTVYDAPARAAASGSLDATWRPAAAPPGAYLAIFAAGTQVHAARVLVVE